MRNNINSLKKDKKNVFLIFFLFISFLKHNSPPPYRNPGQEALKKVHRWPGRRVRAPGSRRWKCARFEDVRAFLPKVEEFFHQTLHRPPPIQDSIPHPPGPSSGERTRIKFGSPPRASRIKIAGLKNSFGHFSFF